MSDDSRQLMDAQDIRRALTRIAHEVTERNRGTRDLVMVGIHSRGVPIARRLAEMVGRAETTEIPVGTLDVTQHRDDRVPDDSASRTDLPFDVTDKNVLLVDEIIYTGRTVRAAMDALLEHGRAATIRLAVLIDRGHREIPVRPDFVGKNIPTAHGEWVVVKLQELDGEDAVVIDHREGGGR
jgi:pyrimidine operon attenuation protein/uracil phosphoribosyltransferase